MISVKQVTDKDIWERFNLASPEPAFLQSWAWGDFVGKMGKEIFRIGVWENEKLVGICLLILEKAKTATFFYAPAGPVFVTWEERYVADLVGYLIDLAKEKEVVFLRLDPRTIAENQATQLQAKGFLPAPTFTQPQTTAVLDLKKTPEELQKALSSSTRYNVGMSLRSGVVIRLGKPQEIGEFPLLLQSTAKKKNLVLQEGDYHRQQYEALHQAGLMEMMIAEHEGKILAASLVVFYGKTAYYLHAANSYEQSNLRVSYPLVWNTILEAKKRGCEVFDFWGVAKDDSPSDPWAGVTAFKMSFGAQRFSYNLPLDLPFAGKYKWVRFFEAYRKQLRRLISFGK